MGSLIEELRQWEAGTRAAQEITAEAGAPGPTHASATWETNATSCATTRPSRPAAGRDRGHRGSMPPPTPTAST
jgi:hypothetical protein